MDQASVWLRNATLLIEREKWQAAEECYGQVIALLRREMAKPGMADTTRKGMMDFVHDVEQRIATLREKEARRQQVLTGQLTRHASAPSSTAMSKGAVQSAGMAVTPPARVLSSASLAQHIPARSISAQPVKVPAVANTNAPRGTSAMSTATSSSAAASHAPVPAAVLDALATATTLSSQREYKRAADLVQYAFSTMLPATSMQQQRNSNSIYRAAMPSRSPVTSSANVKFVEETLQLCRKKYYKAHPPRFLQDNAPTPEEMALLRRSGHTDQLYLPIWDDLEEGYGAENVFMPCPEGQVWEDDFALALNPRQKELNVQLRHLSEMGRPLSEYAILRSGDPMKIRQSMIADCTVVCCLISCASFQQRFPHTSIIRSIIFPQDEQGRPLVNPKGKYCVKLFVNGITRMIVIDDRLPVDPRTNQLTCTCSTDPTELWVSLIEKAFMKVNGGSYDFQGSLSCCDLYKLSGWLPERLNCGDADFRVDQEWERLRRSFAEGAVLATFSIEEEFSKEKSEELMLFGCHGYALLDVREVNHIRVCMLRNPWQQQTWAGALSLKDTSAASVAVHTALHYTREMAEMGVFCMQWSDVLRYFKRISLSWNPYLLYRDPITHAPLRPTRLACHGISRYEEHFVDLPQLHIGIRQAPRRTRMHLVLSRHIRRVSEYGAATTTGRAEVKDESEEALLLGLYIFDVTRYASVRLTTNAGAAREECSFGHCACRRLAGPWDLPAPLEAVEGLVLSVTSVQTVSFDCPAGSSDFVIVLARKPNAMRDTVNFSVTLHTALPQIALPVKPETASNSGSAACGAFMHFVAPTYMPYATTVQGRWVPGRTAGGRLYDTQYARNPQYCLSLQQPALFALRLGILQDRQTFCSLHLYHREGSPAALQSNLTSSVVKAETQWRMEVYDVVLQPMAYGNDGVALDSTMPQVIARDTHYLLGDSRTWPWLGNVRVHVMGHIAPKSRELKEITSFTMLNITSDDEATTLLIEALARQQPVSMTRATLCRASDGTALTVRWTESLYSQLVAQLGALTANAKAEVQLVLSDEDTACHKALSKAHAKWFDCMCGVAERAKRGLLRYTKLTAALEDVKRDLARDAELRRSKEDYLLGVFALLRDYVERQGNQVRPQAVLPQPPLQLPAGDYVLVPSLTKSDIAGKYKLIVETTQPHRLTLLTT